MKTNLLTQSIKAFSLMLLLSTLNSRLSTAFAQGTGFTYQGRLVQNGAPANGLYSFQFLLRQTSNGAQQGPTLTNNAVTVSNGLFTATLDFGSIFGLREFGLEIGVRSNLALPFTIVAPNQVIRPAPLAISANRATSADGVLLVSDGALSAGTYSSALNFNNAGNTFAGNGAALTGVNAATLDGFNSSGFWKIGGNSGATAGVNFIGTTDNQPLELKVNGGRALRIEPNTNGAPNIIGGSRNNFVAPDISGATIAGGGAEYYYGVSLTNSITRDFGTVGGGAGNTADYFAIVAGGLNNRAYYEGTVAGGLFNVAGFQGTVGGGYNNLGGDDYGTVAGGVNNFATGAGAFVGGGGFDGLNYGTNTASGGAAVVPGGLNNIASGNWSFAAGQRAQAIHDGAFVWADSQAADFASTGSNQFALRASGGVQLSTNTSLFFGDKTRQMLNLWGTKYGIGVQSLSTYFRTDNADANNGFIWYKGGVHDDRYANAGGGVELMHLIDGGLYVHGTFNNTSDRNEKQDFAAVDSRSVLDKVAQLPIQTWAYKAAPGIKHLGPVAQDFYASFAIGPDDKHIATVDESGVALAAIQGLNEKLEEAVRQRDERIQRLEARLEALEKAR